MPSKALESWRGYRSAELDEIEAAHAAVGGVGPGRRHATERLNQVYAVLLCSHLQGFARDLHSEAADHLVAETCAAASRAVFRANLTERRKLDRGNPSPAALGADFGRFGIDFWGSLRAKDHRNESRKRKLQDLVDWRNAIVHQDFEPLNDPGPLRLSQVRRWRRSCDQLTVQFEKVLGRYLTLVAGADPGW